MNLLTELSVKRPVGVLTVLITLFIFAFDTLTSFKMASMPQMEMPMFILQTVYVGANPDTIEKLVTEPLSEVGQLVEGFDYETTISQANLSMVIFYFDYGTDMDKAYTDLQQEIDLVALPEDAMDPVLIQMSMDSSTIVQLSVSSTIGDDITSFINDTLVPELETLTGVAEVEVYGVNPGYISIQVDEIAMDQYGISMSQVNNAIAGAKFTIPAGEIEQGTQIISVSAIGELTSLPEIANAPIVTASGNTIIVDDVADVKYLQQKMDTASRYNGTDNLSITVTGTQDADVPAVAETILALCDEIVEDNPTIKVDVMSNEGQSIVDIIMSVAETLLIGIACCMLVLFIFFGDIKASLIVGSSIPLSLMMALIAMGVSGFELNSITGIALIIAIGMIVDSSIVVLESMFLAKRGDISYVDAAISGTKTVGASLVASTITTIVVYLPLAMMEGLSGQMFSQLGYTIVYNMIASIISAVTLVPLAFVLLKPRERKKLPINLVIKFLVTIYEWFVRHFVRWKLPAVINTILIVAATGFIATLVRMEMMPTIDSGYFSVTAEFRPGTKMEIISEETKVIEQMLEGDERITDYYMRASGNTATIDAYIVEGYETGDIVNEYKIELNKLPKMSIAVEAGSIMGAMPGTVVAGERTFTIESVIYADVERAANDITSRLYAYPEIMRVDSSVAEGKTQAELKIDPIKAASYGLSVSDVAMQMSMLNSGLDAGDIDLSGNEVEMRVEYPADKYDEIGEILNVKIATQRGQIPISDLVDVEFKSEALRIDRSKGKYNITLTAIFDQTYTEKINTVIDEFLTEDLGSGVSMTDANMDDMIAELMALGQAILIGTFLVFAVMAIQFESFRFSIMVMMSLAFGGIGAFSLLFIVDEALSMTSLMGFLMLVGLAVNNGILYVDTVRQLKQEMDLIDALVEAGKSRIRPIFMTTLTTILSMLPILFDDGEASMMLKAMALVIIGGLISSTVLILVLMPTFYLILDKKEKRGKKVRYQTAQDQDELQLERQQLEKEQFKIEYEREELLKQLQPLENEILQNKESQELQNREMQKLQEAQDLAEEQRVQAWQKLRREQEMQERQRQQDLQDGQDWQEQHEQQREQEQQKMDEMEDLHERQRIQDQRKRRDLKELLDIRNTQKIKELQDLQKSKEYIEQVLQKLSIREERLKQMEKELLEKEKAAFEKTWRVA
ncbi:efflux RND transporter permease subunit [Candidatus Epulonipiscium viviparus]|uniref:efflux RND transporter permease subunit n=1 Tax=Candidatus Epulonipiscium viviparus TaxID=420336 RepID=UPI0027380ACA|nr:efflux RND transporter permease subunit [Candidatus Epulopiscium viviparus]